MNTPNHPNERDNVTANAKRLCAFYLEASQQVDSNTRDRLRAARRAALLAAQQPRHKSSLLNRWLIPTSAIAAIALATLTLWQPRSMPTALNEQTGSQTTVAISRVDNELPPDAAQADPQLYQNLEFYGWLAANDDPSGTH